MAEFWLVGIAFLFAARTIIEFKTMAVIWLGINDCGCEVKWLQFFAHIAYSC